MPNPVVIFEGTGARVGDSKVFNEIHDQIINQDNLCHIDGVGSIKSISCKFIHQSLWGRGWKNNANKAFEWLKNKLNNNPFMEVNLVGFSRGAVTAIALAWKLNKHLKRPGGQPVPVHIFAWDPIPGGQRDFQNAEDVVDVDKNNQAAEFNVLARHKLPPNVSRYYTVLFEGSKTKFSPNSFWTPINPQGGKERKEIFLPGIHTGPNCEGNKNITSFYIQEFLKKSNVLLKNKNNSTLKIIDYYSNILYYTYTNKHALSNFRDGLFKKNPYRNHLFFVNDHHYETFVKEFPKLAEALKVYDPVKNQGCVKAKDFNHTEELQKISEKCDQGELTFTDGILLANNLTFSPNHKGWGFCKFISEKRRNAIYGDDIFDLYSRYKRSTLLVTPISPVIVNIAMGKLRKQYERAKAGTNLPKITQLTEAEFKSVTKLTIFDARKEQVKEIDNLLKFYDENNPTVNEKLRLIVAIALQVEEHLRIKPTSNRRNGVLALAGKILQEYGGA
jgi:hypothetical protein